MSSQISLTLRVKNSKQIQASIQALLDDPNRDFIRELIQARGGCNCAGGYGSICNACTDKPTYEELVEYGFLPEIEVEVLDHGDICMDAVRSLCK